MDPVVTTTACIDPDTLAAYVDGRLSEVELGAVDRHIDRCGSCRGELSAIASVQTWPASTIAGVESAADERFGRYVVMRELGRGGMGSVVRAYDPELARAVAVKVLHEVDASAYERLRREAQAMARLAHPNVVTVYDVVAERDAVFVAMELIDGETLREFATTHTWQQVLDACVSAGRGLAAAHAAKLIHRDFKPENVLCGEDGRVAVSDFGLARSIDDAADTQIAGTPPYMAPELYRGEPATQASDQFAFCATAYEMLYGQRAFAGDHLAALRAAILDGDVREPPSKPVPARVWKVLARGLAADAASRFPSVTDAVDALVDDVGARRRRRIAWAVSLAGAVAVGAIVVRANDTSQLSCEPSPNELDGAWDATRRTGVDTAIGAAHGDAARVDAVLDTYAERWLGARREACEARHVRGTDSERVLDARDACLDRARGELAGLTELFAHADPDVAERAVAAAYGLRDPASCRFDREVAPRLSQRDDLDRARALYSAGKEADADALANKVVASLPPGFAPQLVAEALEIRGRVADAVSPARGEPFLYDALTAAERAGDDRLAARIWIDLLATTGAGAKHDAAQVAAHAVESRFARIDPSSDLRRDYELSLGSSLLTHGSLAPAREHLGRALALVDANHPDVRIEILSDICLLETRDHRYEAATKTCGEALALTEAKFGPEHPRLARLLNMIGGLEEGQHHAAEGEKAFARAAALLEHRGYQDHLDYAIAIVNLGTAASERYDFATAIPLYERARDLFAKDHPKDPHRLIALQGLADAAQHRGDLDGAIRLFEDARAATDATYAKESPESLAVHYNLALAYLQHDKLADAEAQFDEVVASATRAASPGMEGSAIEGKAMVADRRNDVRGAIALRLRAVATGDRGGNPFDPALSRVLLAAGQLQIGNAADAIAPLERAIEVFEPVAQLADETARARFLLARALWSTGRDRPRARALAEQALRVLEKSDADSTATGWRPPVLRREVAAWLRANRGA
jgi:tetratricopeptide (TPR) repeat protein